MAENAEHAGEKRLPPAVAFAELRAQKPHQRLGHRQRESVQIIVCLGFGIITSRTS